MQSAQDYLQQAFTSKRSPAFPHGKITVNGRLDSYAISRQTQAIRDGTAIIKGGAGDEIWMLQRDNVAVQIKRNDKYPRLGDEVDTPTDIDIEVVDAANGMGDSRTRTQEQLNELIHSVYIVGTDKMVPGQTSAVPLILGGIRTLRNTGNQVITNGALVSASAPDPDNPQPYGPTQGMPIDKVLFWTVPFSSDKTVGSIRESHRLLSTNMSDAERRQYSENFPNQTAFASALERHIRMDALIGIFVAAETGLVTINQSAEDVDRARAAFGGLRQNFAYNLSRLLLRLGGAGKSDEEMWYNIDASTGTYAGFPDITPDMLSGLSGRDFVNTLMDRMFARTPEAWLLHTSTPGRPDTTVDKVIIEQQQENLERMVGQIRAADMRGRNRILGRALTIAAPGECFAIHLGNNLIGA